MARCLARTAFPFAYPVTVTDDFTVNFLESATIAFWVHVLILELSGVVERPLSTSIYRVFDVPNEAPLSAKDEWRLVLQYRNGSCTKRYAA